MAIGPRRIPAKGERAPGPGISQSRYGSALRTTVWRDRALQVAWSGAPRAILLTCAVAAAFAVLLSWHNSRFRHDIIAAYQKQQLARATDMAGELESEFSQTVNTLVVVSRYPQAETKSVEETPVPVAKALFDSHREILARVFLQRQNGDLIMHLQGRSLPSCLPGISPGPLPGGASSDAPGRVHYETMAEGRFIRVTVPIRTQGRLDGRIGCDIDLVRLFTQTLSRSKGNVSGVYWLLGPDGRAIADTAGVTRRASQTHGNETMDAKEAPTTIVKLIQKECLDMGRNGTAQVAVDDTGQ